MANLGLDLSPALALFRLRLLLLLGVSRTGGLYPGLPPALGTAVDRLVRRGDIARVVCGATATFAHRAISHMAYSGFGRERCRVSQPPDA